MAKNYKKLLGADSSPLLAASKKMGLQFYNCKELSSVQTTTWVWKRTQASERNTTWLTP